MKKYYYFKSTQKTSSGCYIFFCAFTSLFFPTWCLFSFICKASDFTSVPLKNLLLIPLKHAKNMTSKNSHMATELTARSPMNKTSLSTIIAV